MILWMKIKNWIIATNRFKMDKESTKQTKQVLFEKFSENAVLYDFFINKLYNCKILNWENLITKYCFYLDGNVVLFVISDDGFIFIRNIFFQHIYRNFILLIDVKDIKMNNVGFLSNETIKNMLSHKINKQLNFKIVFAINLPTGTIGEIEKYSKEQETTNDKQN